MVWSLFSETRRQKLSQDALRSREEPTAFYFALGLIVFYNLVGLTDIASTVTAIKTGVGEEANPVMRAAMAAFGPGWIGAKLMLQTLVSVMVLWFPHRMVLGIFLVAASWNAAVVANNIRILLGV
ncbi:MAG: DUF5658 family protein [Pseudomonadota bacterium]